MSVLSEAMTLVVARRALDRARPGGTAVFLRAAAARPDVRYAIADAQLVAVSTVTPAALDALGAHLAPYGIHRRDGGAAVLVDMKMGPLGHCACLMVRRHPHGLTIAAHRRITARAPQLVTPPAWRPTQSWQLARADLRDDPAAQLLHVGDAHGRARQLDLRTGAVLTGFASRSPVRVIEPGDTAAQREPLLPSQPVMTAARSVLAGIGATFRLDAEQRGIVLALHLDDHGCAANAPDDRLRVLLHPDSTPAMLRVDSPPPPGVAGACRRESLRRCGAHRDRRHTRRTSRTISPRRARNDAASTPGGEDHG